MTNTFHSRSSGWLLVVAIAVSLTFVALQDRAGPSFVTGGSKSGFTLRSAAFVRVPAKLVEPSFARPARLNAKGNVVLEPPGDCWALAGGLQLNRLPARQSPPGAVAEESQESRAAAGRAEGHKEGEVPQETGEGAQPEALQGLCRSQRGKGTPLFDGAAVYCPIL